MAGQNTNGGRLNIVDEWLIGLSLEMRDDGGIAPLIRMDDEDDYWSAIGNGPLAQEIKPGETVSLKIRLDELADAQGRSLSNLRGLRQLRPVLKIRDGKFGLWHGTTRGEFASVVIQDKREFVWGEPVDGVACAVNPVTPQIAPGDDLLVDVMYKNVSDEPVTVCVFPDSLYTWIHVWVKTAEGKNVMGGPHASGTRPRPVKFEDFVTLQPEQTASFRQVIPSRPHAQHWPKPGKYYIHAEINKINRMDKHCRGFNELCKKHGLTPWVAGIESGATPVMIATENPPAAQPGESKPAIE